jgi:hypothetical protein
MEKKNRIIIKFNQREPESQPIIIRDLVIKRRKKSRDEPRDEPPPKKDKKDTVEDGVIDVEVTEVEIDNVPTQQLLEVETAAGSQVWESTSCERNEKRDINNKNKLLVDISYYLL